MDCFIKKIINNNLDESVHFQFTKFSRGEFKDKAMLRLKTNSGKFALDTTAEYAADLVSILADKLGKNKTLVEGAVVSALDISGFKYEDKKMAMGVRKYIINREMTGEEILALQKSAPKAFMGLSFNVGEDELKIQPKSPKSAKGASSQKKDDAEVKIDFCKLKTNDKEIIKKFLLEEEIDSKKLEIRHDFVITEIITPP